MPAPVITPSQTTHRAGSTPLPTFSATASAPIAWTDGGAGGSFSPTQTASGQATAYTPANKTQAVTIQARNTGDNATSTVTLNVEMTFPYDPDIDGHDSKLDDRTNVSFAEDGGPSFMQKGDPFRVFTFSFSDRQDAEYNDVETLWLFHRKTLTFWIMDYSTSIAGILRKGRFDSELTKEGAMNRITYSFVFREAIPY